MQTKAIAAIALSIGSVVGLCASSIIHAQVPGSSLKQIFKADLENLPGQEVIVYSSEWQPGYKLPLHKHEEGHEFVYVIEGEQSFEIDGVGTKTAKAGDVVYTPPNTNHLGRNATDKVSKALVFRIKAKDKPVVTEVK